MRVTALIEDTVGEAQLPSEHGLSLFVETMGYIILFDFGRTDLLVRNASELGVDLSNVDFAVLSHGHYDHGGGIMDFIQVNSHAPIYINSAAFSINMHGNRYIGLPQELKTNSRVRYVTENIKLTDNIEICIMDSLKFPVNSDGLTVKAEGQEYPDDFRHEQYLMVTENNRKILFSGCSHLGIENIYEYFKPDIIVGGMHLFNLDVVNQHESLIQTGNYLNQGDCCYYTCHCTGNLQYQILHEIMKDKIKYLACGDSIEI